MPASQVRHTNEGVTRADRLWHRALRRPIRGRENYVAKFILVCSRDGDISPKLRGRARDALLDLAPDHLTGEVALEEAGGVITAVLNGGRSVKRTEAGLLLGAAGGSDTEWDRLGALVDGTFSICRWSADSVELVSDVLATRTIWWTMTDEMFIASSSQTAIVAVLGSLDFDESVIPWMLATGTLGPGGGWDRRVSRVEPDGVVRLDRRRWTSSVEAGAVAFETDLDAGDALLAFGSAIAESFDDVDLTSIEWRLPLSGGADSRGILQQLLRSGRRPKCVTWGRREAASRPGTDAAVARALAASAGLEHEYLAIEPNELTPKLLVDRFLRNGEGRIDHIAAYLDGFESWRALHERGVELVLRGDEAFGWTDVGDDRQARASVGLHLLKDFYGADALAELGLPDQEMPAELRRRSTESVAAWRDRLYHQFRVPVMLAALTDLKLAYVELVNPLIAKRIVAVVRRMPDAARTEKRAWIALVKRGTPGGPFARSGALLEVDAVLKGPAFRAYLRDRVASDLFTRTFSDAFAAHLLARLEPERRGGGVRLLLQRWVKGVAPAWAIRIMKRLRTRRGPRLNGPTLALRAVLVTEMRDRLERAAAGS